MNKTCNILILLLILTISCVKSEKKNITSNEDIYELLKLQLEHIDKKGEGAANLAEEQVTICNQMLSKQVSNLKTEFEN